MYIERPMRIIYPINLVFLIFSFTYTSAQEYQSRKIYSTSSGELIFAWNNAKFNESSDFFLQNPNSEINANNLRFSMFLHIGEYWHYDFTNNLGLFTGLGLRNVGMSTNERHDFDRDGILENYKFVRRDYLLGVPLAFKLGAFKDNVYLFGGIEYELSVHYKQKYWESHTRSGGKTIDKEWFGQQTPLFLASFFAGVQLPKGFHISVKHYLNDFLNTNYSNDGGINDYSRYAQNKITYISLCWQVRSEKIKGSVIKEDDVVFTRL